MKLKRILSWIIDWNISGVPAFLYALIFGEMAKEQGVNPVAMLLFALFVLSFPVLFVFRDVIFKGRSIAKRIFKLKIVDTRTNEPPSRQNLIVRNLFFFIYPIEGIMLIATNKTLGDMATYTTVTKIDAN